MEQCISPAEMAYFLEVTKLSSEWISETVLRLLSEQSADWVWNGVRFCYKSGIGA